MLYIVSIAESRKERCPRVSTINSNSNRSNLGVENGRADADGTAELVSRDQILRREREQDFFFAIFLLSVFSRRYFQHAHFIPILGVGKGGAY